MQQQQRFIVALVASAGVLILWNVLFPPVKPPQNANANANANNPAVAQSSSPPTSPAPGQPTASVTPVTAPAGQSPAPTPAAAIDNVPQRKLRITTPLYEATFDTRGAVATSWIVKRVRRSDGTWRELYSASSTKNSPNPLELITTPPAGVAPEQLFRPFQIVTGDGAADSVLAGRNFKISGSDSGDTTIDVPSGSRQIEFTIHDDATGLDVIKRMTFFADRYIAEIELTLTRNNQQVPAQLVIGPNIGDQGIDHFTFYSFAPEGLGVVNGQVRRINSLEVHSDRQGTGTINWILEGIGAKSVVNKPPDRERIDGAVQWAGVDDTYFGMIAVPAKPISTPCTAKVVSMLPGPAPSVRRIAMSVCLSFTIMTRVATILNAATATSISRITNSIDLVISIERKKFTCWPVQSST